MGDRVQGLGGLTLISGRVAAGLHVLGHTRQVLHIMCLRGCGCGNGGWRVSCFKKSRDSNSVKLRAFTLAHFLQVIRDVRYGIQLRAPHPAVDVSNETHVV